jgi:hypothetical protein
MFIFPVAAMIKLYSYPAQGVGLKAQGNKQNYECLYPVPCALCPAPSSTAFCKIYSIKQADWMLPVLPGWKE